MKPHKTMSFVLLMLSLFAGKQAFAQAQIEVSGTGNVISNGSFSFDETNFTDFGAVFNAPDDVDANQVEKTFTITNNGDADLIISDISIEDQKSYFDITTNATGTITAGNSADLVINFNSHAFGLGFALVKITNNVTNEPYTFYISAKNIECESGECFGVADDAANVCSGRGTCVSKDVCECEATFGGTNCQTPYRWDDGSLTLTSNLDFSPKLVVGSELGADAVHEVIVHLKKSPQFPGTLGPNFGLIANPPENTAHPLGTRSNEYGYIANGNKVTDDKTGLGDAFGDAFEEGDEIKLIYDGPNNTLSFALKKDGETEFTLQGGGPAFTNLDFGNKKPAFAMSFQCFGGCEYDIVGDND